MITLNAEKTGFLDEEGKPYVPFGVNYYDHETGWAPQIWTCFRPEKVREQFARMQSFGVNCARVFMASTAFMEPDGHLKAEIRPKFEYYLDLCREYGIRLIPTGPDHWEGMHPATQPDLFCGEPYLEALRNFWGDMIPLYGNRSEIFAWDLRNEPMVQWDSEPMREGWQKFLREKYGESVPEAFGTAPYPVPADRPDPDSPVLYDYQLYREEIAFRWTENQTSVMRAKGCRQLITIGYIQWSFPGVPNEGKPSGYAAFDPRKLACLLDFDCPHFYPVLGDPFEGNIGEATLRYGEEWVRYCDLSRPVVLEEYGYYGGGAVNEFQTYRPQEHLDHWNRALLARTRGIAGGWLSWPFTDTASSTDISRFGGLTTCDGTEKPWGKSFRALSGTRVRDALPIPERRTQFAFSEEERKHLLTACDGSNRYLK